jgi:hypothetical protein
MDDHYARTYPCIVKDDDFILNLDGIRATRFHKFYLKLTRLHVNGAAEAEIFHLNYNAAHTPNVAALNAEWIARRRKTP